MIMGGATMSRLEEESPELADTIKEIRRFTDGGFEQYDNNKDTLFRLLEKALRISRKIQDWYVYFEGLRYMIWMSARYEDMRRTIKYSDIFFRDSELHIEEALAKFPRSDLGFQIVNTYGDIFGSFLDYAQIDDEKMDALMERYENAAIRYGEEYRYYHDLMIQCARYRDAELSGHALQRFYTHVKQVKWCYVCSHRPCIGAYLLLNKVQKAEELMLTCSRRTYPKRYADWSKYCEKANDVNMYEYVLSLCLFAGTSEQFQYFYEKYWKPLPIEKIKEWHTFDYYLCAIRGEFGPKEQRSRELQTDLSDRKKSSALANTEYFLEWHCYFTLLDKSGVHETELDFAEIAADFASGEELFSKGPVLSTLEAARYMEKLADEEGERFEKARRRFSYRIFKENFIKCAQA